MQQTLKTAKARTTAKDSKVSIQFSQVLSVIQAVLAFYCFLSFPVAVIHLPSEKHSFYLDNFGNVDGNPAGSMISSNGNISSLVVVAYILMIILLIIGVVNLSLRYKYICLLASLILFGLCLLNVYLINSITVQGASANSVTFDVGRSILFLLLNFSIVCNMVIDIPRLKKLQKAQASNYAN